jgi:hypothetical protein
MSKVFEDNETIGTPLSGIMVSDWVDWHPVAVLVTTTEYVPLAVATGLEILVLLNAPPVVVQEYVTPLVELVAFN